MRVLDLTRVVAGPYCAMFLGDLGADVVKVEQPGAGDDTRGWGPPFTGGESAYYLCINRNKRSLTLDLKSKRAVELLRQLVKAADVVIENFRPGTMERLGLGEAEFATQPATDLCVADRFRRRRADERLAGLRFIVQAWGGLMSITGTPDGEPVKVGVAIIDLVAGLMLGKSITAALYAREKIGVGQRIDTSLLEAEVAALINVGSNYLVGGKIPSRWGNAHPNIVPYQNFKTADGYLVIGVASEVIWKRFCQAIGRDDFTGDARFTDNSKRVENRAELIELLSEIFLQRDNAAWFDLLTDAEVPCAPVQTIDQVFKAPQVLHREMLIQIDHPTAGKVPMAGIPVKFSVTPASVRLPPPLLGEHNGEILKSWLGMSDEAIDELKNEKII